MRTNRRCGWVLAIVTAVAPRAFGNGFEQPDLGARAIGRAGAFVARADDLTALAYNVAGLAEQHGTRVLVDLQGMHQSVCFARAGTYPSGVAMGSPFPEVCNQVALNPAPLIGIATDFGRARGPVFAFGVKTPSAPLNVAFPEFVTAAGNTGVESPERYDLVSRNVLLVTPTLAAAYEVTRGLSLGLGLEWSIATASFVDYANAGAGAPEDPLGDFRVSLGAADLFIPGVVASVLFTRIRRLALGVTFRWMDALDGGGSATVTDSAGTRSNAVATLHVPQPMTLRGGVRYRHPRVELPTGDPLSDDVFDVEVDGVYDTTGTVRSVDVTLAGNAPGTAQPLPSPVAIPHNWTDSWGVRVGGDVTIVPGRVAVRAGFSYESGAVPDAYTRLDFTSWPRYGVHAGVTARFGKFDLTAGYVHIVQPSRTVTNGEVRVPQLSGTGPVVNNGVYSGSWDTFALGATYVF